jgi:integrase/recombinase XerD
LDRMPRGVYSDQKCNDYLKIIAAGSGINKHITMHIGRHSFAVLFLEMGGRMEALKKLLGHTKISTTEIYGKISNKLLDKEVMKAWDGVGAGNGGGIEIEVDED